MIIYGCLYLYTWENFDYIRNNEKVSLLPIIVCLFHSKNVNKT